VFVHGFGGDRTERGLFNVLAEVLLRSGQPVLLYDWRGIGRSQGSFSATTLVEHARDFSRITDWFSHEVCRTDQPPLAIGFSLGAALVVMGVRQQQVRLRGAAFLSPAFCPAQDMWPRYESLSQRAEAKNTIVIKPGTSVVLGRPILESLRTTNLCEDVGRLTFPVLMVHGSSDSRIPFERSSELQERFKHGIELKRLEDASHSFEPRDPHWASLQSTIRDFIAIV
jgi:pimeloyl-ACP methyl ester carboxylesterase